MYSVDCHYEEICCNQSLNTRNIHNTTSFERNTEVHLYYSKLIQKSIDHTLMPFISKQFLIKSLLVEKVEREKPILFQSVNPHF